MTSHTPPAADSELRQPDWRNLIAAQVLAFRSSGDGQAIDNIMELVAARDRRLELETSIAQTKRLRNLIRQQGAGSWQRVFESELAVLEAALGGTDKKGADHA